MKQTLTIVLFSILLSTAMSSSFRNQNTKSIVSIPKFNCTGLPDKCKCPYPCLEQVKNENYCVAKKCYRFDENLGECKKSGRDHLAPLILQAIPLTGVFGSGFGNIGRWDLFGMYMGIVFGGCCFIIMASMCCFCCSNESNEEVTIEDGKTCMKCASSFGTCIWAIVIIVFYILGIVWTATEGDVLDADGCPLIF